MLFGDWTPIIGAGLSYLGSRSNAKAATQAAQQQAAAIQNATTQSLAAAEPWGVGSLGGTAGFDPDSHTALLELSPELQSIYQGALTRSGMWGEQLGQYSGDPFAAQDKFYQQQQALAAPEEERLRLANETRQMAQGRLGTTGGARQTEALETALGQAQTQRQTQAFTQAQSLIDNLLGRESGDMATATGLLNIPMQQANLGRGLGADLGAQARAGLQARTGAASNLANVQAAYGSNMGHAMNQLGGLFMQQPQKQV